jgi:hypothetical protein
MSEPEYIVSLAGDAETHARAQRYNERRGMLSELHDELLRATSWNNSERFGSGWFSSTKPPVSTSGVVQRIQSLREELRQERAECVRLSGGSVKP